MVKIPEGWIETTLGEVLKVGRGSSPRPIQDYIQDFPGIPWVKIADATSSNTRFINSTNEFIKKEGRSTTVYPGDLIVSNSATPGIPKFMGIEACVHDGWLVFSEFKNISKQFLYYFFLNYRTKLSKQATGTVFQNLKTDIVRNFSIILPSDGEQQAIAGVLSAFDDKIELLREENQTLEEMGQTLFKEWFGKYKVGDELPDGWKIGKLGEEFDISIGRTPPRAESEWFSTNSKDKKRISIKDMVNSGPYIFSTSEYLTKEAVNKFNIPRIPENTTILSFKMTVGKLAITTEEMLSNEAIAHLKIKNNSKLYSEFIYLYLQNLDFNTLGSTSSIVTAINSTIIKEMNFVIPDNDTLSKFSEIIKPIFKKIKINSKEIESLSNTRDQLLPKLMSGEVRVKF